MLLVINSFSIVIGEKFGKKNAAVMKLNPIGRKVSEVMAKLPIVSRCRQDGRETEEPKIFYAVR